MAQAQNVGEFILRRLGAWGVERVFGYPGDGINGIMGAFHRVPEMQFVQVRHEEMAAKALSSALLKGDPDRGAIVRQIYKEVLASWTA